MNRKAIAVLCLLIMLCGCPHKKPDGRLSFLRTEGIDRIRVTGRPGSSVHSTSHPELVGALIEVIATALPDAKAYDTLKTTHIELFKGNELRHTLFAGDSLFSFEGTQYYDKSGAFARIVATICSGLGSTASVSQTRYKMGENIHIKWTIRNYSGKEVTIPAHVAGRIGWASPGTHAGSWVSGSHRMLRVSAGKEGTVSLKPDESCDFLFTIPTMALEQGRVLLTFSELIREQEGEMRRVVRPDDRVVIIE